jgi:hypothetical protein
MKANLHIASILNILFKYFINRPPLTQKTH